MANRLTHPNHFGRAGHLGNRCGYTLLELLVVCLLVAIMLSMALPMVRDATLADPLDGAVTRILGLVAAAKSEALRRGQPRLLVFDVASGRLWHEEARQDQADGRQRPAVLVLAEGVRLQVAVDGAVSRASGEPLRLGISRRGVVTPATVELKGDGGRVLRLRLHALFPAEILPAEEKTPGGRPSSATKGAG